MAVSSVIFLCYVMMAPAPKKVDDGQSALDVLEAVEAAVLAGWRTLAGFFGRISAQSIIFVSALLSVKFLFLLGLARSLPHVAGWAFLSGALYCLRAELLRQPSRETTCQPCSGSCSGNSCPFTPAFWEDARTAEAEAGFEADLKVEFAAVRQDQEIVDSALELSPPEDHLRAAMMEGDEEQWAYLTGLEPEDYDRVDAVSDGLSCPYTPEFWGCLGRSEQDSDTHCLLAAWIALDAKREADTAKQAVMGFLLKEDEEHFEHVAASLDLRSSLLHGDEEQWCELMGIGA